MTASLRQQLLPTHPAGLPTVWLDFGIGFTRFLTCGDSCDDESAAKSPAPQAEEPLAPRYELDSLPSASTIAAAQQARQQLNDALAATLLMHGTITRNAPTLRLAVEALRTAQ